MSEKQENFDVTKQWEVHIRDSDGEIRPFVNSMYEPSTEQRAAVYEPAEKADIRPTRRQKVERLGKYVLWFTDPQIGYRRVIDPRTQEQELQPIHSEAALENIIQLNADLMPETIVNTSDTMDFAELSSFDPDSDHFHKTLSHTFQRVHDFYAQLRADNPDAHIVETDSNHTIRPRKQILKKLPALHDLYLPGEDYPLLSYYRLANLAPLGVDFISGRHAEFVYGEDYKAPPIIFKHGYYTSATPGATVRKEARENPEVHVMRGHGHSHEQITRVNRAGVPLRYIQLGATCLNSVPGAKTEIDDFNQVQGGQYGWPEQAALIEDFEDGTYNFNVMDIVQGVMRYRDRTYAA